MNFVIVLVTLSTMHPCQPFHEPAHCGDFVTRAAGSFPSEAACENSWEFAWWKYHIADSIRRNTLNGVVEGDTGAAVCVREERERGR